MLVQKLQELISTQQNKIIDLKAQADEALMRHYILKGAYLEAQNQMKVFEHELRQEEYRLKVPEEKSPTVNVIDPATLLDSRFKMDNTVVSAPASACWPMEARPMPTPKPAPLPAEETAVVGSAQSA